MDFSIGYLLQKKTENANMRNILLMWERRIGKKEQEQVWEWLESCTRNCRVSWILCLEQLLKYFPKDDLIQWQGSSKQCQIRHF